MESILRVLLAFLVVGLLLGPISDQVADPQEGDVLNAADLPLFQPPVGDFSEVLEERTRHSRTFVSDLDPDLFQLDATLAPLHYETSLDSGVFDGEVNLTPRRVLNGQLDGWLVTDGAWHYALGQPGDKTTDGWVGFGGRQAAHWFEFRLYRVGYLHWPTRAFQDVGGAPTYDRANLVRQTNEVTLSHGDPVVVETVATWSSLWTTPGGGFLNVTWSANGDGLKEEVVINQAAREWVTANAPPTTPAADTYFGFVLQVDWNDVPRVLRDGVLQDLDGDFSDDETATVELRDAQDRLLALLPIGETFVGNRSGPSEPLRKRFYDEAGSDFLLLGTRVDRLNALPPGDLIYDPTVDVQVGAGADDCDDENGAFSCATSSEVDTPGNDPGENDIGNASFRWPGVAVPQGSIITAATFEPFTGTDGDDGAGTRSRIFLEADDDAAQMTSLSDFRGRNETTNFTAWDDQNFAQQFTVSPDISDAVAEVTNRSGWSSGNALQVLWKHVIGAGAGMNYEWRSYDESAAQGAKLHITFTSPPPAVDVETLPADPVLGLSARLNGNLTDIMEAPSAVVGFEWGDTVALGNATPTEVLTENGTFSFDLAGLMAATLYFFQAIGNGDNGSVLNFTTLAAFVAPAVTTDPVSSQAQTSAVLEGTVTTLGELNITEANVSFEWGLSPTALAFNTTPVLVAIPGSFQATITDLDPGTTYFYRARIQWNPEAFGDVESFTTEFSSFFERPETIAAIVLSLFAILVCILAVWKRDRGIAAICGVLIILAGFVWAALLAASQFAPLLGTAMVAVGLIIFIGALLGSRKG